MLIIVSMFINIKEKIKIGDGEKFKIFKVWDRYFHSKDKLKLKLGG